MHPTANHDRPVKRRGLAQSGPWGTLDRRHRIVSALETQAQTHAHGYNNKAIPRAQTITKRQGAGGSGTARPAQTGCPHAHRPPSHVHRPPRPLRAAPRPRSSGHF